MSAIGKEALAFEKELREQPVRLSRKFMNTANIWSLMDEIERAWLIRRIDQLIKQAKKESLNEKPVEMQEVECELEKEDTP